MRCTLAILTGLLLLAPAACKSDGGARDDTAAAPDAPPAHVAADLRGEWRVTAIRGEALAESLATRAPTMTITDEGRVGGSAGINRWSSTLDPSGVASGHFALGPIVTTLMAGTPEAMDLEQRFLGALGEVTRFDPALLAEGRLALLGPDGRERLRLERAAGS